MIVVVEDLGDAEYVGLGDFSLRNFGGDLGFFCFSPLSDFRFVDCNSGGEEGFGGDVAFGGGRGCDFVESRVLVNVISNRDGMCGLDVVKFTG